MLQRVRIVLVEPSHPGNIGASARAMKNMGLTELALVAPEQFPDPFATARASGAEDILERARVCDDLVSALQGCHLVYACSARARRLTWPNCDPKACAKDIGEQHDKQVAIVFGRERIGLTNEELAQCHYHVTIPTDPNFSSLNLAASVQVLAYELRQHALSYQEMPTENNDNRELVTAEQMHGLFQHLNQTLISLDILDPNHPKMLMRRLHRLFYRAQLDEDELNILRGILTAVNKHL